jgi:CheY-like chemotaxis protein
MSDTRLSVLVIDDESSIRNLIINYLDDYDEFDLHGAESGEEALAQLERRPMDLCVVDSRLPGITGQEFIAKAYAGGLCKRFLVHSGSIDVGRDILEMNLGIREEDIFLKPSRPADILSRLREIAAAVPTR